jgi:hypothetical protein
MINLDHINTIMNNTEKEEVNLLSTNSICSQLYKQIIHKYANTINSIRETVVHSQFSNHTDEITFYKELKPKVLARYLYYIKLLDIHSNSIDVSIINEVSYLKKIKKSATRWVEENMDFICYMRKEKTHFDDIYFTIKSIEHIVEINPYILKQDSVFSTSKSFTLASYYSKRLVIKYCLSRIEKLQSQQNNTFSKVTWKKSKIDLIEALDALHLNGAFDCDFKTLVNEFGRFLNIDKLDPYNNITKIRTRSPKDRTKFLDSCKESLQKDIKDYLEQ